MSTGRPRREPRRPSPYSEFEFAACYERLAVPHHFAAPARDLVAALELSRGAWVLDVGCGTAAAALQAAEKVGPHGLVVALDPSLSMLHRLPRDSPCARVAGEAPGLPFASCAFDAAFASFALSHFPRLEEGLADMVRVLRSGGVLGVTAWGASQSEAARTWREVAASFLSIEELDRAFRDLIPWDEWLSAPDNLRRALEGTDLDQIEVRTLQYRVAMNTADFLAIREQSVEGTLLRDRLGPDRWSEFRRRALGVFQRRFPQGIEYVRAVNLGLGSKTG